MDISNIKYTDYAEKRLRRRKITTEQVSEVLTNAGQVMKERGRTVAQSRFMHPNGNEHLLRVIYEERGVDVLVVTVYETSRIQRYWRAS